jgi:frataxin-like iron-binding protein CyaY
MSKIKWIDINKKEPLKECLAIGYQKEMIVGYCYQRENSGEWVCESDGQILEEVTHWIDLKSLIKLLPK